MGSIIKIEKNGHPVNFVRCDNAGENTKLENTENIRDSKLNLELKYTGNTIQ